MCAVSPSPQTAKEVLFHSSTSAVQDLLFPSSSFQRTRAQGAGGNTPVPPMVPRRQRHLCLYPLNTHFLHMRSNWDAALGNFSRTTANGWLLGVVLGLSYPHPAGLPGGRNGSARVWEEKKNLDSNQVPSRWSMQVRNPMLEISLPGCRI